MDSGEWQGSKLLHSGRTMTTSRVTKKSWYPPIDKGLWVTAFRISLPFASRLVNDLYWPVPALRSAVLVFILVARKIGRSRPTMDLRGNYAPTSAVEHKADERLKANVEFVATRGAPLCASQLCGGRDQSCS
jgi:hypothetical protein